MDPDSRTSIVVLLLFIASAYFALTETAIASVSRNRIKVRADKGTPGAQKVLYVLDNFEDAITTLLVCTNIAHIAAAALVTLDVTRRWGLTWVTASTFITTLAMFFIGEMLPKSIGKKTSERSSLVCAGLLVVLMKVLRPVTFLLSGIGRLTLKLMHKNEEVSVTEDEIYDIIEDMTEEGSLDEEQSELISSALSFGDLTVTSIMTPRVDVEGIDINTPSEKILENLLSQTHSRLIVYDGTVDNVVGVLQLRRFLKSYISRKTIPNIRRMTDKVFFAHQSMPIDELFDNMTSNKFNIAVVLDGFGGTAGIVTIEDIIEEIVGEIWDEDDEIKEPIVRLSDDTIIASCDETVESVFEEAGYEEKDEGEEERFKNLLLGDFICEKMGVIPKKGDSFEYNNLKIRVEEVDHNRVMNAKIVTRPVSSEPESEDKDRTDGSGENDDKEAGS
ncbi:MAG: HlyC/CorC family transporter [Lachnospiraceae bacterium]|nr:HlyC/CorC family transporter [Lachnospiraceae bacterium]